MKYKGNDITEPSWLFWAIIGLLSDLHDRAGDVKRWLVKRTWCKWRGHKYKTPSVNSHLWKGMFGRVCLRCGDCPTLDFVTGMTYAVTGDSHRGARSIPSLRDRNGPLIFDDLDYPLTPEQIQKQEVVYARWYGTFQRCPRCSAPLVQAANGIDFDACEYCDFGKTPIVAGTAMLVHGVDDDTKLSDLDLS